MQRFYRWVIGKKKSEFVFRVCCVCCVLLEMHYGSMLVLEEGLIYVKTRRS